MNTNEIVQQCTAGISINRNKIKRYGDSFYLKNAQEFEIEIRNTLSFTVLAKISINGKFISNSGLVLKPGQKVYLERYIDTNKKFKFETYEVEIDSPVVAKAIANNGNIEIIFYKEKAPIQYNPTSIIRTSGSSGGYYGTFNSTYPSTLTNTTGTSSFFSNTNDMDLMSDVKYRKSPETRSVNTSYSPKPTPVETGRVEQGSISNQSFSNYSGEFESYSFQIVRIKLLPLSAKPLEVSDLAEYCTQCGTKNKKGNYKFCPKCGTKY